MCTVHRQHDVHARYKQKTNNVSNHTTPHHAAQNYPTIHAGYKQHAAYREKT